MNRRASDIDAIVNADYYEEAPVQDFTILKAMLFMALIAAIFWVTLANIALGRG